MNPIDPSRRLPQPDTIHSKFFALYLLGYRMPAISIIGEEVMTPLGLLGLGCDTMDCSGPQVREALMLYASPKTLPSLVHCTHGKDRTGKNSLLFHMPGVC